MSDQKPPKPTLALDLRCGCGATLFVEVPQTTLFTDLEKAVVQLGVAWVQATWSPRPRASQHLHVAIYPMLGQLKLRIWMLGEPGFLIEREVASVYEGARWADKKLRGLMKALGVVES